MSDEFDFLKTKDGKKKKTMAKDWAERSNVCVWLEDLGRDEKEAIQRKYEKWSKRANESYPQRFKIQ